MRMTDKQILAPCHRGEVEEAVSQYHLAHKVGITAAIKAVRALMKQHGIKAKTYAIPLDDGTVMYGHVEESIAKECGFVEVTKADDSSTH
jgi:hypothetical protein